MITICVAGCANMSGFGKFSPDDGAAIAFETYQINPDYRYYTTGSSTFPVAVVALDKSYTMGNDLWDEVLLTSGQHEGTGHLRAAKTHDVLRSDVVRFSGY